MAPSTISSQRDASKFIFPPLRFILITVVSVVIIVTSCTSASLSSFIRTIVSTSALTDNHYTNSNDTYISTIKTSSSSLIRSFFKLFGIDIFPLKPILYDLNNLPQSLTEYIEWHEKQRTCILDPTCKDELPPTLIWQCPFNRSCAGIGDRFRGIQITFLIAVASKRLFFIDMPSDPYPFTDVVVPSLIDWRLPKPIINTESIKKWPHLNWYFCKKVRRRGELRLCRTGGRSPHDRALPHINANFKDINAYRDDISNKLWIKRNLTISCRLTSELIPKLFQNKRFMDGAPNKIYDLHTPNIFKQSTLLQLLMHLLFEPSEEVKQVINNTVSPEFINKGYISVHARTGQDVGELFDKRFTFFNAHILHAVRELLYCAMKMNPIGAKRIYLATDSMKVKNLFLQLATNNSNHSTLSKLTVNEILPKGDIKLFSNQNHSPIDVRYINERAFHFGLKSSRGKAYNQFRTKNGDKRQAYINVFADLFILSGGKAILTTGSGFARAAYWLGHAPSLLIAEPGNGTDHCADIPIEET